MQQVKEPDNVVQLKAQDYYIQVIQIADKFCRTFLTKDKAALVQQLADQLYKQHPDRLIACRPSTWACSLIYTVSQFPTNTNDDIKIIIKPADVVNIFSKTQGTIEKKSRELRKLLRLKRFANLKS